MNFNTIQIEIKITKIQIIYVLAKKPNMTHIQSTT